MEKPYKFSDNLYGVYFDELNNYQIKFNAYEEPENAKLKYVEKVFIQKVEDDFDKALEDKKKRMKIICDSFCVRECKINCVMKEKSINFAKQFKLCQKNLILKVSRTRPSIN